MTKSCTMTSYVFDTYAIIEILKGNRNYNSYIHAGLIINDFILAELCYYLLREYGKRTAQRYLIQFKKQVTHVPSNTILEAMVYRYQNKKKRLSMTDCIGYMQAKDLGVRFLTGDKEFRNVSNVEFAK